MRALMRFPEARRHDPAVAAWLQAQADERGDIARHWFEVLRACGDDVHECLHDGQATACVDDAAFAYVAVYRAHVDVGFFDGAALPDPARRLEGSGKHMRHAKVRPGATHDDAALRELVAVAYALAKRRVADASGA